MFDFFRKYNKVIMVLLFLLIIPSFVLFGVDRYQGDGQGEKVARVDGSDITQPEWDAQHRNEVDSIRQQAPDIEPGCSIRTRRAMQRWSAWCATACSPRPRPRRT